MMDRQGLAGETYHGEYQQQGDLNREDLNGDLNASRGDLSREDLSREDLRREDLGRGDLCNLVVFHPSSNNCHTGELVAANNNNNNVQVLIFSLLIPMVKSTSVIKATRQQIRLKDKSCGCSSGIPILCHSPIDPYTPHSQQTSKLRNTTI